jgi:hypothetical protein
VDVETRLVLEASLRYSLSRESKLLVVTGALSIAIGWLVVWKNLNQVAIPIAVIDRAIAKINLNRITLIVSEIKAKNP